eukprot:TRINITY_DN14887_c0_g1_i1.p2 TRINITY_DN14887_c0_g1~~TRINITY_DN14887_c0_g1_i1.p2  ORF type:complete len:422 (+),score=83.54 TRINITY_DN14887_c0_g1_i1:87-1268(+)
MSQGAAQRRRCAAARLAAAALVIAAAALTLRSVPTEDADPAEQLSAAAAAGAPDAFSALLGEFCDRPKLHPSDLRHGLRVWAYPDPWTPGLLRHWNTRALRHQYSCDFGCRLCDERSWGNRGADMGMRQHGSGLSLLAKLLQLPHAESPEQADLFLVPVQFNLLWNREWHWISPMNDTAVAQAVASLRYLTPRTAGRHLFLPGGEEPSIHPAVRAMPLAAHLGPRVPVELCDAGRCYPARPQHIVIPSPLLQPDTQPGRYVHNATRPVFVFFFGGDPEHLPARRRAVQQLRDRAAEAKQRGLRLEVHTILSGTATTRCRRTAATCSPRRCGRCSAPAATASRSPGTSPTRSGSSRRLLTAASLSWSRTRSAPGRSRGGGARAPGRRRPTTRAP